jgi:hypothetical protein
MYLQESMWVEKYQSSVLTSIHSLGNRSDSTCIKILVEVSAFLNQSMRCSSIETFSGNISRNSRGHISRQHGRNISRMIRWMIRLVLSFFVIARPIIHFLRLAIIRRGFIINSNCGFTRFPPRWWIACSRM